MSLGGSAFHFTLQESPGLLVSQGPCYPHSPVTPPHDLFIDEVSQELWGVWFLFWEVLDVHLMEGFCSWPVWTSTSFCRVVPVNVAILLHCQLLFLLIVLPGSAEH